MIKNYLIAENRLNPLYEYKVSKIYYILPRANINNV